MTRFRLLGPLEASVGDRPVALPGGKPSALLARLLLDAGRVVAVETLVDSIWGEHPPPSAQKVLQVYVSQLRKALGAGLIETQAPGYLVRAEHDLAQFETLTGKARDARDAAGRAKLLGEALSLWRGTPLAEFRDEPFAPVASRRLEELRLGALEQRIEAELELGEHARLVGELEALVEQEPLREWPRRQFMLALYRSGRQAEALESYREGRRLLVDELGIEPSPRLQELERAILRHDPALDGSDRVPARRRGAVICPPELAELLAPLCAGGRELILVGIVGDASELVVRAAALERVHDDLAARGVEARTVCFTSTTPEDDLARLATEQEAELLVVSGEHAPEAPCDVAVAPRPDISFELAGPVVVPFGGGQEEWAALELGAWLARSHGVPLRLLGAEATEDRRDASRLLASASLALQRFAGTAAEPVLVAPGAEGVLAEQGSVIVASLSDDELDATRQALIERTTRPLLLVRTGLRPGGLAPEHTLTRFSWSLSES